MIIIQIFQDITWCALTILLTANVVGYAFEALLVRVINVSFLNEGISFELKIDEELCSFISLYRSPSQTQGDFDKFTENLELNLDLAVQPLCCCGSCCIFADDTHNVNTSTNELNNDLAKIDSWAFQQKMNFNASSSKQAQKVIFSRKSKKRSHAPLFSIKFKFHNPHLRNILVLYLTKNLNFANI